jgi:predicted NBD/HSP70 family sugar kinase
VSVRGLVSDALGAALRDVEQPEQRPDVPLMIVNDADAEALAEVRRGAAEGVRSLLMVKIGGGVGGAAVIDGQVHRGEHGFAGEFGHVPVDAEAAQRAMRASSGTGPKLAPKAPCPCGHESHLQSYASVEAIMSRIKGAPIDVRSDDEMRAFVESTRSLQHTQTNVSSILWQAGWLVGCVLRAPVMGFDPEVVMVRPGIGPVAARRQLLEGVRASLWPTLPSRDYDLRLGTHAETGVGLMSLVGASLYGVDRFVAPRVHDRAQGRPVPPALRVTAPERAQETR